MESHLFAEAVALHAARVERKRCEARGTLDGDFDAFDAWRPYTEEELAQIEGDAYVEFRRVQDARRGVLPKPAMPEEAALLLGLDLLPQHAAAECLNCGARTCDCKLAYALGVDP